MALAALVTLARFAKFALGARVQLAFVIAVNNRAQPNFKRALMLIEFDNVNPVRASGDVGRARFNAREPTLQDEPKKV